MQLFEKGRAASVFIALVQHHAQNGDSQAWTPKGTRAQRIATKSGEAVHIYSNSSHIILQIHREVPTEQDISGTSFKVSVTLAPAEALAIAGELLTVAALQIKAKG